MGGKEWKVSEPEDLVPNLSRCMWLRKAGYKQGYSYFVWCGTASRRAFVVPRCQRSSLEPLMCDAPTVTELMNSVPQTLGTITPDEAAARWLELHILTGGTT